MLGSVGEAPRPVMDSPLIEMRQVRKAFNGQTVLDGVDLAIEEGSSRRSSDAAAVGKSVLLKHLDRPAAPRLGRDPLPRPEPADALARRAPRHQGALQLRVPEHGALRLDDRSSRTWRCRSRSARARAAARSASASCGASSNSTWATSSRSTRRRFRAACASAWRWPAPSSPNPRSCSSTTHHGTRSRAQEHRPRNDRALPSARGLHGGGW